MAGSKLKVFGALATFVALAAAGTVLGITLDALNVNGTIVFDYWINYVLVVASAVSILYALVTLSLQVFRFCACSAVSRSTWVLLLTLGGTLAHLTLLACTSADWYDSNIFVLFELWSPRAKALYIFGEAIGAAAWVVALLLAFFDFRATKRQESETLPTKQVGVDSLVTAVHIAPVSQDARKDNGKAPEGSYYAV